MTGPARRVAGKEPAPVARRREARPRRRRRRPRSALTRRAPASASTVRPTAPRLPSTRRRRPLAQLAPARLVEEKRRDLAAELVGVGDLHEGALARGTRRRSPGSSPCAGRRPRACPATAGSRMLWPPGGHEAAAHEDDVRQRVDLGQLAQGVEQQHLARRAMPPARGRSGAGNGSPGRDHEAAPRRTARDGAGRSAGAAAGTRSRTRRKAASTSSSSPTVVLPATQSGRCGAPPFRCGSPALPTAAAPPTASNFRLPVTRTRSRARAHCPDALGVGLALHQEEVDLAEHAAQRSRGRSGSAENERVEIRPLTIATRAPRRRASWIRFGQISVSTSTSSDGIDRVEGARTGRGQSKGA